MEKYHNSGLFLKIVFSKCFNGFLQIAPGICTPYTPGERTPKVKAYHAQW